MKNINIKVCLVIVLCGSATLMHGLSTLLRPGTRNVVGQNIRQNVRTVYKPGVGLVRAQRYFSTIANKPTRLSGAVGMQRLMSTSVGRSNAPLSVPIRSNIDNSFNTPQVAAALKALEPVDKYFFSSFLRNIKSDPEYDARKKIYEHLANLYKNVGMNIGEIMPDGRREYPIEGFVEISSLYYLFDGNHYRFVSAEKLPFYELKDQFKNLVNSPNADGHTLYYYYLKNCFKNIDNLNRMISPSGPGIRSASDVFRLSLGAVLNERDIYKLKQMVFDAIQFVLRDNYSAPVIDYKNKANAIVFLSLCEPKLFDKVEHSEIVFTIDGKSYLIDGKKINMLDAYGGSSESAKEFKQRLGSNGILYNEDAEKNAMFDFVKERN